MASQIEKYYREPIEDFNQKELVFQAIEWQDFNENDCDDENCDEMTDYFDKSNEKYVIRIFGVNEKGNSVCLNVENFTPFFYIKVPDNWKSTQIKNVFLPKLAYKLSISKKKINDLWVTNDYSKNILFDKCVLQNKHDFFGFTNKKLQKFMRLTFNNGDAMKKAINLIKYHNNGQKKIIGLPVLPIYESNIDPIIRFAHIKNLKFAGWIKAYNIDIIDNLQSVSYCQIECTVDWRNVELENTETNAPILQASYDIETYSIDGSFPSPEIKGNVITQIATAFKIFGHKHFYIKHIICLKQCSPIKSPDDDNVPVFVECYNTETEVLLAWKKLLLKMDADVIYQYNGDQFDGNYLYKRSKLLKCDDEFLLLGKLKNTYSVLNENQFSSSAYGSSNFKRLTLPGRINFDILIYIKREYKENSYKLDYISEKYIGQNKNPVTPQMMFKYFEDGNPDKIKTIAEYCIMDTLLPQKLVDKMHILQNQLSMSNVTYVPIRYLIERGQLIKVFSQVLKETRKYNFLVPTFHHSDKNPVDGFTGATVLTPLKGAYYEPITVCDFASLYPSIIRAHNLCYSTIVLDDKYDNIEGVEYKTFEWNDTIEINKNETKIIHHKYKYVQNKDGILPSLLSELTIARKNYKNLMKNTNDPFLSEVYNKCQLAVKVSMNSVYGFLAGPMLCCVPIAASVTYIGRTMIEDTKKYMETNYNASVAVYGDSVTGDTPLLLKDCFTNKIYIKSIDDIGTVWKPYKEFKFNEITNRKNKLQSKTHYQIWTDKGWSNIKRVIKHTTNKSIHRVISNFGAVDVTEDHSLLNQDFKILKPLDCNLNTNLLFSYTSNTYDLTRISNSKAFVLGLFDGYGTLTSIDNIINSNISAKKSYLEGFYKNYNDLVLNDNGDIIGLKIKNKLTAAKFYNLLFSIYGNIYINIQHTNNNQFYRNVIYIIYLQKFHQTSNKINHIYNLDEVFIHNDSKSFKTVYDLETECGRFQAGIGQTIIKNTDSVFIKFTTPTTKEYIDTMEKNKFINSKEHDLQIQHLKTKCIQESIELGKIASKNATNHLFKSPINLEYEKVYCPLLLLSKKKYIGVLYSNDPYTSDLMDNKGVILKRRDNFELLKKTYSYVLDVLLKSGKFGIEQATNHIEDTLYKIINNDFDDLNDFIISKLLKSDYKSKNIPHLVLANKLKLRDPGSAPNSNDRVPYVFTYPDINTNMGRDMLEYISQKRTEEFINKVNELSNKKYHITSLEQAIQINKTLPKKAILKKGKILKQYEKVEDPEYLLKNKLPLDAEYYINFMKTPISEILALFIDNPEKIFDNVIKEYQLSKW